MKKIYLALLLAVAPLLGGCALAMPIPWWLLLLKNDPAPDTQQTAPQSTLPPMNAPVPTPAPAINPDEMLTS